MAIVGVDQAVVQRVKKLLGKTKLRQKVKEKIRKIARGAAGENINLEWCDVGPEGVRALAEALRNSPHVKNIDLRNNNLGLEGARAVAQGLKHVGKLHTLNLGANSLGLEGARAVAEGLKDVANLQELDLGGNSLGPAGARAVAQGLKHMGKLQTLKIDINDLGAEGARAVAERLKDVANLQELSLQGNDFGLEGARAIGAVLPRDREIHVSFTNHEEAKAFNSARPATAPVEQHNDDNDKASFEYTEEQQQGANTPECTTTGSTQSDANLVERLQQKLQVGQACVQSPSTTMQQLQQQLAAKEEANKQLGEQLKARGKELALLKAANQQQVQQLEGKDAALATLTAANTNLEYRIQQLQQQFERAEASLNLNIPSSRFCNLKKARDHKRKVIKGGYGTLHTAKLGGHRVALKQIDDVDARPHLAEILEAPNDVEDEESKRLYREALILLSIRHPNIVSFLGLSHDDDNSTLSFVLSWAEGGSLYDHLHVHKRELTKTQRERIAMEVAGAMQFLQAHGVVHRDLKSPNVLLDGSLSAKVTDFGLSAFKRGDDKTLTHQKGTPLWASPEQLLELKLYADTDVFSFGVLY